MVPGLQLQAAPVLSSSYRNRLIVLNCRTGVKSTTVEQGTGNIFVLSVNDFARA